MYMAYMPPLQALCCYIMYNGTRRDRYMCLDKGSGRVVDAADACLPSYLMHDSPDMIMHNLTKIVLSTVHNVRGCESWAG